MKTSIQNLQTEGLIQVTYPRELRRTVDRAVVSWKRFCSLPTGLKKSLPYSNNADGVGYEMKDGIGIKADKKENFDITLGGQAWLKENIRKIRNEDALEFVEDAVSLVGSMKPLILDFARQAEKAFDLKGFAHEVENGEDAFFVRFIHYFGGRKVGEEIASAHADQSGFTPHLFESAAGLQRLAFDGKWVDMPVSSNETVIIPSMQMQLRSGGKLKAVCHRVVATLESAKDGRYSAVCFVQLKETPKYDKEKCGRLQEKEPGFNYSMPFEEFSKLFK